MRSAINVLGWGNDDPEALPKRYAEVSKEPHELGRILVSALFEAFAVVFRRRTKQYNQLVRRPTERGTNPELIGILADQASKLANQFLPFAFGRLTTARRSTCG